jgi:hypothetical protein
MERDGINQANMAGYIDWGTPYIAKTTNILMQVEYPLQFLKKDTWTAGYSPWL